MRFLILLFTTLIVLSLSVQLVFNYGELLSMNAYIKGQYISGVRSYKYQKDCEF